MVQRPIPQRKAPRAAERSAAAVVRPMSTLNENVLVVPQEPESQEVIWEDVLEKYIVLLLDPVVGWRKTYVASKTEPQPKEVNLREFHNIGEGWGNLREYLDSGEEFITHASATGPSSKKRRTSHPTPPRNKRRIPRPKTPETDEDDDYVSDAEDELDGVLDGQEGEEYYSQSMKVANLHEYFVTAFKMLGQLGCKDIGKAWIKMGHPKKQTTNPYNGGNTKQESMNRFGFAGALKTPDYWPPCEGWQEGKGCRHQEPDHIKKPERLILLNHLLHCGHPGFTLEKLEMGTAQIEREIPKNFTAKSIKILKQIYHARRMEIRFEEGGMDADTVINLYMPKPTAKATKVSKAMTAPPIKGDTSQRVADNKRSAKASTAAVGSMEQEDLIAAQMDLDSTDETESTVPDSAPASTVSSVASECLSLQSTQRPAQYKEKCVPKMESGPFVSVQPQWSRHSSFSQTESPRHATTGDFGGLPFERTHHPSQKRGSLAHARPSSSKLIAMSREQRASSPHQGENPSHFPPTESDPRNGFLVSSEHRRKNIAQSTRQQPSTLSNSPAYPVNPARRPVALKPMTFSGSSSGFAGLPPENPWQTVSDHSHAQQFRGLIYTEGADPNALLTSYPSGVTSSFGDDYSEHSFGNGLQTSNVMGPSPSQVQASQQALDAEWRQQYPTYITSNFSALAVGPGPSDYTHLFPTDSSTVMESKFNPYGQEARYP